jgi:NAD(P)-dependent dehydrogenase (short-subunit alcohol dehydrogenase family)
MSEIKRLAGQVAIVTGGGQGVGQGIAYALAKEGAHVVLTGRTAEKLRDTAASIEQQGVRTLSQPAEYADRFVHAAPRCFPIADRAADNDRLALGYLGDPENDIGRVAVLLASDDAHCLTGQTLNADGGQWMF